MSVALNRLLNVSPTIDEILHLKIQTSYADDIKSIQADPEAMAALNVLLSKGFQSSRVHGAYLALVKANNKGSE